MAVSMGASCCDDNHNLGDEKNGPTGNIRMPMLRARRVLKSLLQSRTMSARPPKNKMAAPAAKACGDFALALVLAAANLTHRLDGQTLVVVDGQRRWG